MLSKLNGIILGHIPYSENSIILKCYTDALGMQSYMVNSIKGKKSAIKPSQLLPLTLVELEVYFKQGNALQRIKELKVSPMLNELHFRIEKSAIAMFMAELLGKCLREEQQTDKDLFDFIAASIQILDLTQTAIANFPLVFMYQLSKYLGFYPKPNFCIDTPNFSLMEGLYVAKSNFGSDHIEMPMSERLFNLGQVNYQEMSSLSFTSQERRQLLTYFTRYYQLHVMLFGDLKSPAVLHEVLNT
jgi:DNA repair protein RecO (recombination protein O)